MSYWLVVWHMFYFSIYWECHHPNWRTPSFFRGVGIPPSWLLWHCCGDVQYATTAWQAAFDGLIMEKQQELGMIGMIGMFEHSLSAYLSAYPKQWWLISVFPNPTICWDPLFWKGWPWPSKRVAATQSSGWFKAKHPDGKHRERPKYGRLIWQNWFTLQ